MCNDHASLYSEETNVENYEGEWYTSIEWFHIFFLHDFPLFIWVKRSAIKILLRKRQFLVRFVGCHARILPIKIFFLP